MEQSTIFSKKNYPAHTRISFELQYSTHFIRLAEGERITPTHKNPPQKSENHYTAHIISIDAIHCQAQGKSEKITFARAELNSNRLVHHSERARLRAYQLRCNVKRQQSLHPFATVCISIAGSFNSEHWTENFTWRERKNGCMLRHSLH